MSLAHIKFPNSTLKGSRILCDNLNITNPIFVGKMGSYANPGQVVFERGYIINWDSEIIDTDNMGNGQTITCVETGHYKIVVHISIALAAADGFPRTFKLDLLHTRNYIETVHELLECEPWPPQSTTLSLIYPCMKMMSLVVGDTLQVRINLSLGSANTDLVSSGTQLEVYFVTL
jgi:hypothetical protein